MTHEKDWDGKERRHDAQDHDTLIEVVTILKRHVENFDAHVIQDDANFKTLNRIVYTGVGILVAIEFIFKIVR